MIKEAAIITVCGAGLGAVGFGAGTVAGWVGDKMVIDGGFGYHQEKLIQDEIDSKKELLLTYEGKDQDIKRFGDICLNVLANYGPDGPLKEVSENEMVDDLLKNEDKPCGEDATKVRIAVQEVTDVKQTLDELGDYDFSTRYADLAVAQQKHDGDIEYNNWLRFAVVVGAIGTVIGLVGGRVITE